MTDPRIVTYRDAALAMKGGRFSVQVPVEGSDDVAQLGLALSELARSLENKFNEIRLLSTITQRINTGLVIDEILNDVFESFRPIIPYHRIGFSLIEGDGKIVCARWARSDAPVMKIVKGYSARMEGSSLVRIIETGEPRILNDLAEYLRDHPNSDSTRRIVAEGMRSSLTCPLIAMGKAIGFMFFSSMEINTYQNVHVDIFRQIAGELSIVVEKGRLYQELLELNDLKNKFLGMAAHDLRNPLAVAKGFLSLVLDESAGPLTPEQKESFQVIYSSFETMMLLVNDLLDVNAIESGKLVLQPKEINLGEFLHSCASFYTIHAKSKQIAIRFNFQEPLGTVVIDRDRINQVLGNLLSNAIKFSRKGTTITLHARKLAASVEIAVEDQGQGIPEKESCFLFKEFSRLSIRPTDGEQSTGLGLAIAKRIVEVHGGTIFCTSRVGVGSKFTFILPQ
jgi:signal transduction histidine kinase